MRRLRRIHQKHIAKQKNFKKQAVATGAAAVIALGACTAWPGPCAGANKTMAVDIADKHQLAVNEDTDADLLADKEEFAIGYKPFTFDQNNNQKLDGAELAKRLAAAIAELPWEQDVTDPNQTYKWHAPMLGLETCSICGETVNMGPAAIVNPKLGLQVDLPLIALHYLEHGSFSYAGDINQGRLDVAALSRALEIRFPYDPNEHLLPVADDLDGDFLADNEELIAGYNLYDADQNNNITPDGIELAKRCAEVIDALPVFDPNGPEIIYALYKEDFAQRGIETCNVCGHIVNMGYCRIVNLRLGLSIDVPYILLHFMQHGSFSYSGDVHGQARIDVAILKKIIEMPRQCGDLGTIYSPADLNMDCKVDNEDLIELIEKWLQE